MPRWPEHDGREVRRLDGFAVDGDRFTLSFTAPPARDGEAVTLAFDGVATVFTVTLNGVAVLSGTSMFAAHEVDIGSLLCEGENELVVDCGGFDEHLAAQPRRPRTRWRPRVVADGAALRFVRTAILGRAPGFAPGPPIVGPWRPVWLVSPRGAGVAGGARGPRPEGGGGGAGL